MRYILLCLVCFFLLTSGCEYDDPEEPGEPGAVDFIRFTESGRFREEFVDLAFQSGELAVDTLTDPLLEYPVRLGPGLNLMWGISDDDAPYPNPAGSRKQTVHTGALDNRYWVQFAGGAWQSLNIEVEPRQRFRASSSPPSFLPLTRFRWCPATRPCMDWLTAVGRREVRCFKYGLNGNERPVGASTCALFHPRKHWRVQSCDDCPIPAGKAAPTEFARTD